MAKWPKWKVSRSTILACSSLNLPHRFNTFLSPHICWSLLSTISNYFFIFLFKIYPNFMSQLKTNLTQAFPHYLSPLGLLPIMSCYECIIFNVLPSVAYMNYQGLLQTLYFLLPLLFIPVYLCSCLCLSGKPVPFPSLSSSVSFLS